MREMVDISIDTQSLRNASRLLESMGDRARPLISKSLNRAGRGVVTDASRGVRQEYNVKARPIRESFSVHQASRTQLSVRVASTGSPISLYHFGPRPRQPGRRPKRGVSVKVTDVRKKIPGSFIANVGSTRGVFQRKGRSRLPILKLTGPSVPQMLNEVSSDLQQGAEERFSKNLDHEIERNLRRRGLR